MTAALELALALLALPVLAATGYLALLALVAREPEDRSGQPERVDGDESRRESAHGETVSPAKSQTESVPRETVSPAKSQTESVPRETVDPERSQTESVHGERSRTIRGSWDPSTSLGVSGWGVARSAPASERSGGPTDGLGVSGWAAARSAPASERSGGPTDGLGVSGWGAARSAPASQRLAPTRRFTIVVPAHDEAEGIARTVQSALAVDWPPALRRVLVVADNCTDDTAQRARAAGAEVLERREPARRGKGYALELAFRQAAQAGADEAVVVIDADSVVSANLLQAFDARLAGGAVALQAHYGVRNPRASWRTRLMTIALALFHRLRSLARERLGVSCGLRGNGMCFRASLLAAAPYDAFSLVEDLEYGIRLGRAGHRVQYVPEARVLGEMAVGERASRSQRRRWEGGRAALARQLGRPLLREALARRSALLLDLWVDAVLPPLSQLALASALGTAAALTAAVSVGHLPAAAWLFAACDAFLAAYVLKGVWLSGLGARGLLDLAAAPPYVAWKLWLALAHRGPRHAWIRTTREGGPGHER